MNSGAALDPDGGKVQSIIDRPTIGGETEPQCIVVAGATGGIGSAFCAQLARRFPASRIIRLARRPEDGIALSIETVDVPLDIGAEKGIEAAVAEIPKDKSIDWVFVATGWLHDQEHTPEKTYKSLDADHLMRAYQLNAVGPALLLKHLFAELDPTHPCKVGVLSARVGSISDNRLGGWHAYRASKAALNMLIKNFAIELSRTSQERIIVGLQPGTTDTALSKPFQRNVPQGQLQSPEYTAAQLLRVMQALRQEDSGSLLDFLGIPFDP